MKVVQGHGSSTFLSGETVFVRKYRTGSKYFYVKNPRNGYDSSSALGGGWLIERFGPVHELDEILGL